MNTTQIAKAERSKVFLACILCKNRKRKCDGGIPKCSNCMARGVECNYAAIRRTRGPGKKKTYTGDPGAVNTTKQLLSSTPIPENRNIGSETRNDATTWTSSSIETLTSQRLDDEVIPHNSVLESIISPSSSQQLSIPHLTNHFPSFLHATQFPTHLSTFRAILATSTTTQTFTPLLPLPISHRLIQNSFTEIISPEQLLSQSSFLSHLEAQYTTSASSPASHPARWALINSILALAVRFKTTPALADIAQAFYQNATKVLPELLLQEPSLLAVQALLAMALFSWNGGDMRAFVVLGGNASRLLELLGLKRLRGGREVEVGDSEEWEMVCRTVEMFDESIAEFIGIEGSSNEGYVLAKG